MPKANVFNMDGKKVGEIDLSEAIFGIEPNKNVMYDSVKNHLAEGHRPCTRRLCRIPGMDPRRRSIRSEAP